MTPVLDLKMLILWEVDLLKVAQLAKERADNWPQVLLTPNLGLETQHPVAGEGENMYGVQL